MCCSYVFAVWLLSWENCWGGVWIHRGFFSKRSLVVSPSENLYTNRRQLFENFHSRKLFSRGSTMHFRMLQQLACYLEQKFLISASRRALNVNKIYSKVQWNFTFRILATDFSCLEHSDINFIDERERKKD